jgi:hypothetical protein
MGATGKCTCKHRRRSSRCTCYTCICTRRCCKVKIRHQYTYMCLGLIYRWRYLNNFAIALDPRWKPVSATWEPRQNPDRACGLIRVVKHSCFLDGVVLVCDTIGSIGRPRYLPFGSTQDYPAPRAFVPVGRVSNLRLLL